MKNRLFILFLALLFLAVAVWTVLQLWQGRDTPPQATAPKQALVPPIPLETQSDQLQGKSVSAAERTTVGGKLRAGGREWTLFISDSTVTNEAIMVIAKDLNLIFGSLSVSEIDKLPFPIDGQLNGKKVQLTQSVRLQGGVWKCPQALPWNHPFMCLVAGGEESGIYIPKEVTDAYLQAIERSQKYDDAYGKLRKIIEALNNLDQRPILNVKELFLLTDDNQSQAAGLAQTEDATIASAWGPHNYREPSLLEITETRGTPFEKYGTLVAQLYEGPKLNEFFPLIYRNERWQILVGRGE